MSGDRLVDAGSVRRKVTELALPAKTHGAKCGRQRHKGRGICANPAGFKTAHPGVGPCKYHDGRPPRHGRYSVLARESLRELSEHFEADEDPLNLLPELAHCRALYADFINRYDTITEALLAWYETQRPGYKAVTDDGVERPAAPRPGTILDIVDAYRLISEITKIAKRIEDVRAQNAIARKDFVRLMQEMARVVEAVLDRRIDQPEYRQTIKDEIKDRWLEIRLV